MPVYQCSLADGIATTEQKAAIANDIMRIHCELTGAPTVFVHVFFFDVPDMGADGGVLVQVTANIRAGRTEETKAAIIEQIARSVEQHTGTPTDRFGGVAVDTPASWVMEGGAIFPEPGEEAAWLAEHGEKLGMKLGITTAG